MTTIIDIAPGLQLRGKTPPLSLEQSRLLVLAMDSAMLYPGVQEFATACSVAGMVVNTAIGEHSSSVDKLQLLEEACKANGIDKAQVLVVGRSASDLSMMVGAGISIAFMAVPEVAAVATIIVASGALDRILPWVQLAAANQPKDLDLSVLETLVNNDPGKLKKFALLFIESIEAVLSQVDLAIASQDLPTLVAMGHRAKSTAKSIGAEAFSNNCLSLEQTARAGKSAEALEIASNLRPQFESIRETMLQRYGL